ncbi:MAG: GtrA family protein [Clostridia bacterium]|nr:GtrA family protein [Clostridia bacterium]
MLSELLSKKTINQFKKYLFTGLSAAALEYGLFNLLIWSGLATYLAAHTVSMLAGFFLSFFLNKYWSFGSLGNTARQLTLTGALFIINLGISNLLMYLLVDKLGFISQLSKLGVMALIVLWNFILFKKIIYRS